ncbi:late competence development ComFB family protein [Allohahella marinimesophila]|uniref:Late competence development protein ComFB n=1 Tax=Allohahella marinimesophila TaxID=1054972 RepID=A0ABP7NR16_9GAMM
MTVLDNMYNYYERMVIEELALQLAGREADQDKVCDMACISLNTLPPRYIRHSVDMAFFLQPDDLRKMRDAVAHSVREAIRKVSPEHADPASET